MVFQKVQDWLVPHHNVFAFALLLDVTILILMIYVMTSKKQRVLQTAERTQRVCGDNAFEGETLRYTVLQESEKTAKISRDTVIASVMINVALTFVLMVSAMIAAQPTAGISMIEAVLLNKYVILGAVFFFVNVSLLVIVISSFDRVYKVTGVKDKRLAVISDYKDHIETVMKMFKKLREAQREANDNNTDTLIVTRIGEWETYRNILGKRLAQSLELSSLQQAKDMVDEFIEELQNRKPHEARILKYIEFGEERDHKILMKLVPKIITNKNEQDDINNALNQLKYMNAFNPAPQVNKEFSSIYLFLAITTIIVAYPWYVLARKIGLAPLISIVALILILTALYTRV